MATTSDVSHRSGSQHLGMVRAVGSGRLWCAGCSKPAMMVSVDQASAMANVSVEALLDRITERRMHSVRMPNGDVLLCLESFILYSNTISESN